MIRTVAHHEVLVRVVPEQRMRIDFGDAADGLRICTHIVGVLAEIVELDRNEGACLRIFYLEIFVFQGELQPVVAIELAHQVSLVINQCKFLCVATEQYLTDGALEILLLTRPLHRVKQNVVNRSFATADDRFATVFVHVRGLLLEGNLLL